MGFDLKAMISAGFAREKKIQENKGKVQKLYHGTSEEGKKGIESAGQINVGKDKKVWMTSNKAWAEKNFPHVYEIDNSPDYEPWNEEQYFSTKPVKINKQQARTQAIHKQFEEK